MMTNRQEQGSHPGLLDQIRSCRDRSNKDLYPSQEEVIECAYEFGRKAALKIGEGSKRKEGIRLSAIRFR